MDADGETIGPDDAARLRGGATFEGVRFRGVVAGEASLRDATFLDCDFIDCDLTLARMDGATVRGVRFGGCRLAGVDLGRWRGDGLGIEAAFVGCDLDRVAATTVDLRTCTFEGGRARHATFERCDLRGVAFDGVDLSGARFRSCDLRGADLRAARGVRLDPCGNRVERLRVSAADAATLLHALGVEVDA